MKNIKLQSTNEKVLMCYDILFLQNIEAIKKSFPNVIMNDQLIIDFTRSHIMGHAYPEHPIIYRPADSAELVMRPMEWGCIPFYVKDEKAFKKQRASMLNARSEKILDDSKSYWHKIRNRRCLVPVSGFYEHREVQGFKNKIPYLITLSGEEMFFLPALYSVAELPDMETGELLQRYTFTIVTRNANSVMAAIHNGGNNCGRMPLILPIPIAKKWVQEELSEDAYRQLLNFEIPSEKLNYQTVYTIRSPKERPDGKEKNEEYIWENLPDLTI